MGSTLTVRLANAPVSYGVFEMTAGGDNALLGPDRLVDAVADAGYVGIDLGPVGYLGVGAELHQRLARRGLGLAGGWCALRFVDQNDLCEDLAGLDRALDVFEAAAQAEPDARFHPKPTLADAGSAVRQANPGRGKDMPEIRFSEEEWKRFADGVAQAADRCRARGLEPTFHHHACTYVEAPEEVERFLDLTDVGLCLDTGHLLLGGGDPVRAIDTWGHRVNHVHLKDARRSVLEQVIAERAGMQAVWKRGAFCELGTGDLDVDGFLDRLRQAGYAGWVVVEQDRIPDAGEPLELAAGAQARNRDFLRARGFDGATA